MQRNVQRPGSVFSDDLWVFVSNNFYVGYVPRQPMVALRLDSIK